MAIKAKKNPDAKPVKKSLEEQVKAQASEIEKLKQDKLELQLMTAELFEQTQADKLELQIAMAELAEEILLTIE